MDLSVGISLATTAAGLVIFTFSPAPPAKLGTAGLVMFGFGLLAMLLRVGGEISARLH